MPTPRKHIDPDGDKRRALRLLAVAGDKLRAATANRDNSVRFAIGTGASLREAADAAGVSHQTVKNILERSQ